MTMATYQQQLRQLVRTMSMPNREADAAVGLADSSTPARVKMFVDGNLEKRFDKLRNQLAFVAASFDDFDQLITDFIRSKPLQAFGCALSDGEEMLKWLFATQALSDVQRDYIACQRARHTIEEIARADRLAYVRFQELASVADDLLPHLGSNESLRIVLNPTRNWATFESDELLEDDCQPPANVLFFATRGEIATAALELEGQALLNELVDYQPCTIAEWSRVSAWAERDELIAFCRDLAEIGLVAIS